MDKVLKLCQEELIFSNDCAIQNLKFLNEDFDKGLKPRQYDFEIEGQDVTVIILHHTAVTTLMATFRNMVHFKLIVNWEENVILASPSANPSLMSDDLVLEDYTYKIAENLIVNENNIADYGSKINKNCKNFQLWNFYNYKLMLDV